MAAKIAFVGLVLFLLRALAQVEFYKAYFEQKQKNYGKDPRKVLREEFPFVWWVL